MKQSLEGTTPRGLEAAVQLLFHSFVTNALGHLNAYPEADAEGLHEARKDIKKLRSLLRLLKGPLPKDARQQLNAELRESARMVSASRDKEVLLALFRKWRDDMVKTKHRRLCQTLESVLQASGAPPQERGDASLSPECRSDFLSKLLAVDARFLELSLGPLPKKQLLKGLARSRKRTKKAYLKLRGEDNPLNLHNLRKRNKDLCYHLKFLEELTPSAKGAYPAFKEVDDDLGLARDCDLAIQSINGPSGGTLSPEARRELLDFISAQRKKCLTRALDDLKRHP